MIRIEPFATMSEPAIVLTPCLAPDPTEEGSSVPKTEMDPDDDVIIPSTKTPIGPSPLITMEF